MIISAIRTRAKYFCDELSTPSSGKFSDAWWLDMANYIKNVVARETGHYLTKHRISLAQYTQVYAMPSTLCWGIIRATLDGSRLEPYSVHDMDEDPGDGWLWEYGFPNQPNATTGSGGVTLVSDDATDTTQTATIYGTTYATNTVTTEDVVLTGTTPVASTKTNWGDIYYILLDDECAGDLTVTKTTGGATICTIDAGDTSAGNAPNDSTPDKIVTLWPNLAVHSVPSEAKTLYLLGGTLPSDYTGDSDDPGSYGVPPEFQDLYVHGMAAMAQLADIYDAAQDARANAHGTAFWGLIRKFSAYLDGLQRDREQAIRFYNPHVE